MFITNSVGKKINPFLRNARVLEWYFKFVRKAIFEQTYKFVVTICFFFSLDIIKFYDEQVILFLFCIFSYVTYVNSHPQLKYWKWKKCKVGHEKLRNNFRG